MKQKQTIFQSCLLFKWAKKKARPGLFLAFQTKIALSSDQAGHFLFIFQNFSFSKWLYFIFKVCTFSSCLLLHVCGLCQIASLKIQTKNEILTLHIVEIRVGRCPTWLTNWKQKYLVIWLETLRHFPQFLLHHSLLATTAHNSCA